MDIRPGRYRHFKGGEYEVLGVAAHSETLEPMVVYRALYGEKGLWVRPASMWEEQVERVGGLSLFMTAFLSGRKLTREEAEELKRLIDEKMGEG